MSPEESASSFRQISRSGNHVFRQGDTLVKRYPNGIGGYVRERAVLGCLAVVAPDLPVPRLDEGSPFAEIRYPFFEGVPATELAEGGNAGEALRAMGAFLRALHSLDVTRLKGRLPGAGTHVVHGDFGAHNSIVDPQSGRLRVVVDWEEAHLGDPACDLAWCESQWLARFPRHGWALAHLFEGYGPAPGADERRAALDRRLTDLGDRSFERQPPATEFRFHRIGCENVSEAAAFVAALSRVASGPRGSAYRLAADRFIVGVTGDPSEVFLSDLALHATKESFGAPARSASAGFADLPRTTRVLFGAGIWPAWGIEEAARQLAAAAATPAIAV